MFTLNFCVWSVCGIFWTWSPSFFSFSSSLGHAVFIDQCSPLVKSIIAPASSGNRTRAARVAGEHSTTEPTMLWQTPTALGAITRHRVLLALDMATKEGPKKVTSPSGNRTPVSRVTGGDTYHYTNEDWLWVNVSHSTGVFSGPGGCLAKSVPSCLAKAAL